MSKTKLQRRAWLNPIDSCDTGSMHVTATHRVGRGPEPTHDFSADLTITDCYRSVTLDFSAYCKGKKEFKKRLGARIRKIEKLQGYIEELAQFMRDAYDEA